MVEPIAKQRYLFHKDKHVSMVSRPNSFRFVLGLVVLDKYICHGIHVIIMTPLHSQIFENNRSKVQKIQHDLQEN